MNSTSEDELKAGTGFMMQLSDALHGLEEIGYTENLIPKYDHFESRSGVNKFYPSRFKVDRIMRFENTSDPDDQSILYAISSLDSDLKGAYVESYGLYHDDLSPDMIACLMAKMR